MRIPIGLIAIFVISLTTFAQTPAPVAAPFGPQTAPAPPQQPGIPGALPAFFSDSPTRVFPIRYVDSRSIERLIQTFGVPISREPSLNAISVRAPEKTLNAIEEMIKRFDIAANAPKRVEVTAYLLLGSPQVESDSLPAALKPVIDQLRSVMTYKSYRVLDTTLASGKEGDNISEDGVLSKLSDGDVVSPVYSFGVLPRISGEGSDQYIHLDNLSLTITIGMPGSNAPKALRIGTAVDVKKGQQVVVGKATVQDRAIILVLSAKILD